MRPLLAALRYLIPHWWYLAIAAVSVGAVAGLSLLPPLVVRFAIDRAIGEAQPRVLLLSAAALIGASLLRGGLAFGQRYLVEVAGQRAVFRLRNDVYQKLQGLSFAYLDRARTGELMSRAVGDVETLRQFFGMGIINLVSNALQVVGIAAVLFGLDARLSLVALLPLPAMVACVHQLAARVRPAQAAVQEQLAALSAVLQENISGIRIVQAFAREGEQIERFAAESRRYLESNLFAARLAATYAPLLTFLSFLSTALVLWYGGGRVVDGALSLGGLVAFNTYLLQLVQPLRHLGWLTALAARSAASAERVIDLLRLPVAVADRPGAIRLERVRGEVRFERVSFAYQGGGLALRDIDLVARPGERIALVGPTGSGKSTLTLLIPRFYDVSAGRVLIDGHDVRDVQLKSLRRQIAVVMQETFLFAASIAENIAYGRPEATRAEIEAAARAAQLHEFIASLPAGYDTLVGERGVRLSGGQKQRVAIARALLLDAPVLILDESTSSVDAETEALIHRAFDRVMRGRTSFIVAQRLTTVRAADRIVVLDGGRVVEQGRHEELLARGGLYRRIVESQLGAAPAAAGDGRLARGAD